MGKFKIKTRKERESQYVQEFSHVSIETWDRLMDYLSEYDATKVLEEAIKRRDYIREHMTYSEINIIFYEEPVQTHRGRFNRFTKSVHSPNAKENFKAIERLVRDIKDAMQVVCTPMLIEMTAFYPMPSALHPVEVVLFETRQDYAACDPDFDNVLKAYCDMIQTHIILDDDLVCSAVFNKYYSLKPRVELKIKYPDKFASKSTYKKVISRKSFKELGDRVNAELILDLPNKRGLR